MPSKPLGIIQVFFKKFQQFLIVHHTVFVTGNANKLREVKAILSDGPAPIEIESRSVDGKPIFLTPNECTYK